MAGEGFPEAGEVCDRRDWSLLLDVFTVDATGDYGQAQPGSRTGFVELISSHLDGCGPTQHLLGNHVVRVEGDTATARCAVRAFHAARAGSAAEGHTYTIIGSYHDRLLRTAEGWRITHRRMVVDHEVGDPAVMFGG